MNGYFNPPQPAILIAPSRSGSTFLCHCLDSHYQIACERGEPFSPSHNWQRLRADHRKLALALWQREGYRVAMFKASYRQLKNGFVTLDLLREVGPKVIHLHRENIFQAIVSAQLCTATVEGRSGHPVHSYEPVEQQQVEVDCETLVAGIEDYRLRVEQMQQLLSEFETLELTYEQVARFPHSQKLYPPVRDRICEFLGVQPTSMGSEMVRVNPAPIILNRARVKSTLGKEYGWMLA